MIQLVLGNSNKNYSEGPQLCVTVTSPVLRQSWRLQASQTWAMATPVPKKVAPSLHVPWTPCVVMSSAQEKCVAEMSSATFRMWRLSMETWVLLNRWSDLEAVMHIRLTCVPALQHAVDSRYAKEMWINLTPMQASDNIEALVLVSTNQVVL
ncbi:hypothetical protein SK128_010396 [Halocaridina rubra]|uniref:Uncharacterized protein n=1 Tax=Halocaridina rubra TaxID=373956 RepID=A0AAN8ZWN5_HALRR